jgi:hypothetical protein
MANDDEALPLDLLEAGDPAFVDAIREVHDADALAEFATTWFEDRRPSSRKLLFEYLDRPLNAFRHEALIKRLFKKAEAEGDDPLMGRFLVLFDRSIRRVRRKRKRSKYQVLATKGEAHDLAKLWEGLGYRVATSPYTPYLSDRPASFHVSGQKVDEVIVNPRQTTMPRGRMIEFKRWWATRTILLHDWAVRWYRLAVGSEAAETDIRKLPAILEKMKSLRLFSVATRNYLRRRAWRYFRKLGKMHPERYVAAASEALTLYVDDDAVDGLSLIDNWGLVHILFHHCPALEAKPRGWTTRPGHSLTGLAPAPIFEGLWREAPGAVVGLLTTARSTTVRRWAIRRVEADLPLHRAALSLDGWLDLLKHDDPAVVALAAGMLDEFEGLEALDVDRWLALAESTDPSALEALCDLIAGHVDAGRVTLDQAVRLALLRPLPVAKLGLAWLREKAIGPGDLRTLLALVEAECEPLRPEMLAWLRGVLSSSPGFEPAMVLGFLDSRHADARREGWAWFRSEPRVRDDVETWRKLLESPHDDVRLPLVAELEARAGGGLEAEALRALWAGVLLNVHRGNRAKPGVVRQILRRLEANPGEAPALLPLLGVALRSVRGPERRAGLVAVVRLVENRAEVAPLVQSSFPELQMT